MHRLDREDTSAQQAKLEAERQNLLTALDNLIDDAKAARKVAASGKTPNTARITSELANVYGASRTVETAETNLDIAATDLASASGHDV